MTDAQTFARLVYGRLVTIARDHLHGKWIPGETKRAIEAELKSRVWTDARRLGISLDTAETVCEYALLALTLNGIPFHEMQ